MAVVVKTKLIWVGSKRRQIVVRPAAPPRRGWAEQFRQMRERGEGRSLWPDTSLSCFHEKEWDWI